MTCESQTVLSDSIQDFASLVDELFGEGTLDQVQTEQTIPHHSIATDIKPSFPDDSLIVEAPDQPCRVPSTRKRHDAQVLLTTSRSDLQLKPEIRVIIPQPFAAMDAPTRKAVVPRVPTKIVLPARKTWRRSDARPLDSSALNWGDVYDADGNPNRVQWRKRSSTMMKSPIYRIMIANITDRRTSSPVLVDLLKSKMEGVHYRQPEWMDEQYIGSMFGSVSTRHSRTSLCGSIRTKGFNTDMTGNLLKDEVYRAQPGSFGFGDSLSFGAFEVGFSSDFVTLCSSNSHWQNLDDDDLCWNATSDKGDDSDASIYSVDSDGEAIEVTKDVALPKDKVTAKEEWYV